MRRAFSLALVVAVVMVVALPGAAQGVGRPSVRVPTHQPDFQTHQFIPGFGLVPIIHERFPVFGLGFDAHHFSVLHRNHHGFFPGFIGGGFVGPNFAVGGFFPFPVATSSSSVIVIQQPPMQAVPIIVQNFGVEANPNPVVVAAGLPPDWERIRIAPSSFPREHQPLRQLTLLVLKDETIYAVTDYWLEDGRIFYVTSTGKQGSFPVRELDWEMTTSLNAERGFDFVLRSPR